MTEQVRKSYRENRARTWTVALAIVALAAAIVIPLASGMTSGGRPATYTFAGNASACEGASSVTLDVVLTNTSKTQNLGSADLYAPANVHINSLSDVTVTGGGSTKTWALNPSYPNPVTPDPNDSTSTNRSLISLRNLTLAGGSFVTVHATAAVTGTGLKTWYSIAKQANQFNPGDLDQSNTFTITGSNPIPGNASNPYPYVDIETCQYYFAQGPVDTQTGTAQTVKVQLRSGTTPVPVSGALSLDAYQTGTVGNVNSRFTPNPLQSTGGLDGQGGQDASNTWTFSVTGNVSGNDYFLRAGNGTSSQADSSLFDISDCVVTSGSCSSPIIQSGSGSTAGQFSGSGIIGTGVNLSFSGLPSSGAGICNTYWGWTEMTYPYPNGTNTFDGITLSDFSLQPRTGYVQATLYFRNDLYVQTAASQTNDIEICAGVKHTDTPNASGVPFMGRNSTFARWDGTTGLWWGVLARIPNCNKVPDVNKDGTLDPALCAWGTVTNPFGDGYDYRTATVIVPYDWDIQFKG